MMPGETIRSGADSVCDCGTEFKFEVLQSGAGYYVGTTCHNSECEHCGEPNSRESGYYRTRQEAEKAMNTKSVGWR